MQEEIHVCTENVNEYHIKALFYQNIFYMEIPHKENPRNPIP